MTNLPPEFIRFLKAYHITAVYMAFVLTVIMILLIIRVVTDR